MKDEARPAAGAWDECFVFSHCWVGGRKNIWPVKYLCNLFPKVLFHSNWRPKT